MKNQIKLRVWGEYGLFTRPEMKVERVSYDVMDALLPLEVYWRRFIGNLRSVGSLIKLWC